MDVYSSVMENPISSFKPRVPLLRKPIFLIKASLARQYSKFYPQDMFIGVTGSFGKSVCVEAARAVLSKKYKTLSTSLNSNSQSLISEVLLKLTPHIKKVVLEFRTEFIGEMDFNLSLVTPKIAIFTKITHSNSEISSSLNEILDEKNKLALQLPKDGFAILNWDDPNSKKINDVCGGSVVYYGTDPNNCIVWAGNIKVEDFRTTFELNAGVERMKVNLQLLGPHQVYPVLAAAALGVLHKIPLTKIKLALEEVLPQEHKLQPIQGPNGSILLDDSYDSTPVDLEAAIDTLFKIPARRRILVLGEMKGLGSFSEDLHRKVAQLIYKEKVDQIYLGTGDANIIAEELKNLGFWEEKLQSNLQNSQLVGKLLKSLGKGDVCLIKGSRSARLDEIVKRITKK